MVVVEPVVTREKISQLLAEQHESAELDFKVDVNAAEKADEIELVKDVAAMMAAGGFIVVGAYDDGTPSGKLTDTHSDLLDEARLRPKLAKYLPDPIHIRVGRHTLPTGDRLAIIYVGPHPDGFVIFRADGQYQPSGGQKTKTVFRAGDVFVRHGTSSEKWNQDDIARALARQIAAAKESWRGELAALIQSSQSAALQPEITRQLDAETFRSAVIKSLRANDDVALGDVTDRMTKAFYEAVSGNHLDEVELIFDRLTCLAATETALGQSRPDGRSALEPARLYFRSRQPGKKALEPKWRLGLMAGVRAVALGGLAVRRRDWATVRMLASLRVPDQYAQSPYFLRDVQVEGAQADVLGLKAGRGVSLISLAVEYSNSNDWMRPDLPTEDEELLDSVCQFDALAAIVAMAESGDFSPNVYWPDFAAYYTSRIEPIVLSLITDRDLRKAVFPWSDEILGRALGQVNRIARSEYFLRFGVWDGFVDDRIVKLIQSVSA